MKWFIKALRHYADFSGRARRKEFWMFALFNFIFYIVWAVLLTIVFAFTNKGRLPIAANIACLSYAVLIMLPAFALAVRRLHDVGKSGWMLLISLIPVVGGIWLFVLMVSKGQQGDNKYGPDPKTSPETVSDQPKLKSAGVTLIVASSVAIVLSILTLLYLNIRMTGFSLIVNNVCYLISTVMLLIAGFFLLSEEASFELREKKKKNAIILLLAAVSILFVIDNLMLMRAVRYIKHEHIGLRQVIGVINVITYFLFNLLVVWFTVSILFSPQNKELVRKAALAVIVISGLFILWSAYFHMHINAEKVVPIFQTRLAYQVHQVRNLLSTFNILKPVAFIVLAGAFFVKERETSR